VAPRPAPASAELSAPYGDWEGSLNGRFVTLHLAPVGDDGAKGELVVTFMGKQDRSAVRGTLRDGTLVLEDPPDRADGGVYTLAVSDQRLDGSFTRRAGGTMQLAFTRP
jgi:hypothetical protein